MKRTIITSALILAATVGFSQPAPDRKPPTPEQVAQREANALSERLSLTEDQRTKAYSIYLDKATKDIAAREERMKEMQKQRELSITEEKQQQDKINDLLNADQKKTFESMRERMNTRRPGPGGAIGMRQGPQGESFRRGPGGNQLQGPRPDRLQRVPDLQFDRPVGPRSDFQRGPGQQFQRGRGQQFRGPGAPDDRLKSGPQGQFRDSRIRPDFQVRPDGRGSFQQRNFKGQDFKQKFNRKFHKRALKHRAERMKKQQDKTDLAPKNKTAPADSSK